MTLTYSYEQLCDGFTLAGCRGWLSHAAEQGWTVIDVPADLQATVQETPQAGFTQNITPLQTIPATASMSTEGFPLPLLFFAGVAAVYGALSKMRGRAIKRDWFQQTGQTSPFPSAEYTEPSPWEDPVQMPAYEPVDMSTGQAQQVYPYSQTPTYPLEPLPNWGCTGSEPILNQPPAPILNQSAPGCKMTLASAGVMSTSAPLKSAKKKGPPLASKSSIVYGQNFQQNERSITARHVDVTDN